MNRYFDKLISILSAQKQYFYKYWNRLYFKLFDIKYGLNLSICNKIYIRGRGKIVIGDNFKFTSGDNVNPICRNLRGAFYVPEKDAVIEIGNNVGMSSACLWSRSMIRIEDNVLIGGDCIIMDNDAHSHNYIERRMGNPPINGVGKDVPSSPVIIEKDVWIGARCIILKGVHIGARSIIAAGSVVVKDIPSDVIAGGNPCVVLKNLH